MAIDSITALPSCYVKYVTAVEDLAQGIKPEVGLPKLKELFLELMQPPLDLTLEDTSAVLKTEFLYYAIRDLDCDAEKLLEVVRYGNALLQKGLINILDELRAFKVIDLLNENEISFEDAVKEYRILRFLNGDTLIGLYLISVMYAAYQL